MYISYRATVLVTALTFSTAACNQATSLDLEEDALSSGGWAAPPIPPYDTDAIEYVEDDGEDAIEIIGPATPTSPSDDLFDAIEIIQLVDCRYGATNLIGWSPGFSHTLNDPDNGKELRCRVVCNYSLATLVEGVCQDGTSYQSGCESEVFPPTEGFDVVTPCHDGFEDVACSELSDEMKAGLCSDAVGDYRQKCLDHAETPGIWFRSRPGSCSMP